MDLVVLGTVHKAKGLEYDNVILADDFVDLLGENEFKQKVRLQQRGYVDEFNLIYVGVTRAKMRLRLGPSLKRYIISTGLLTSLQLDVNTNVHTYVNDRHSSNIEKCLVCNVQKNQATEYSIIGHIQKVDGSLFSYVCSECISVCTS